MRTRNSYTDILTTSSEFVSRLGSKRGEEANRKVSLDGCAVERTVGSEDTRNGSKELYRIKLSSWVDQLLLTSACSGERTLTC